VQLVQLQLSLVRPAQQARLVQQVLPVHKVQLALKVQLDRRGRKAFKEIKA
jgi:hypothetical protein